MTQAQAVLRYIKKHGFISRSEAWNDLHIANLTAVIDVIRQGKGNLEEPVEIITEKKDCLSDFWGKTDYAVYKLAK